MNLILIFFFENENIIVYLKNGIQETELLQQCIEKIEKIVLNRVSKIWGSCYDVNADGKIAIVFSDTINAEKKAVGFFNQNDFFKRVTDKSCKDYNPYSNEMDVIYVAVPESLNGTYSVNSICATVSHELTHAVNFSNKTYLKMMKGEKYNVLDLFLDEGLSHLTESLCGLGISGGNMDFVNFYLKNSFMYSIKDRSLTGLEDTAGRRGGVCLFLYYLFEQAGGMDINADGDIIDKGGIKFLNKIIQSDYMGWNAIGEYFGISTDYLFIEFCKEILAKDMKEVFNFNRIDPITLEPFFMCNEFTKINIHSVSELIPYSIVKFDICYDYIQVECSKVTGNAYFMYK